MIYFFMDLDYVLMLIVVVNDLQGDYVVDYVEGIIMVGLICY